MEGLVAYQGALNPEQSEIVRFPLSGAIYQLGPHDTVTFVCEDPTKELKYNGESLGPHVIQFYTYTCMLEEGIEETNTTSIALPLTCEVGQERRLRGSGTN